MRRRSTRQTRSVGTQLMELAVATPQVVTHRMTRLAMAGPVPSERDSVEFRRMVAEKQVAFAQAWQSMAQQTLRAQQTLAFSMFRSFCTPLSWGRPAAAQAAAAQMQSAALGILGKGLAPVHRKAVGNAKRLARTKLR